jgi:hypothetical protein
VSKWFKISGPASTNDNNYNKTNAHSEPGVENTDTGQEVKNIKLYHYISGNIICVTLGGCVNKANNIDLRLASMSTNPGQTN